MSKLIITLPVGITAEDVSVDFMTDEEVEVNQKEPSATTGPVNVNSTQDNIDANADDNETAPTPEAAPEATPSV